MRLVTPVAVLAVLVAVGCSDGLIADTSIRGSGTVVSEVRPVAGFDEVAVLGFGTLEIDISGSDSLEIEAEDNLMQYLTSEVKGNRLELSTEEDINLNPTKPVLYRITAEQLNEILILGSADVRTTRIDSDMFRLTINGSGDVELMGTVTALEVVINGSGDFTGSGLTADTAAITINGSGNGVVNALRELDARIAGSGSVEYLGNPSVAMSVTGSGSVSKR